MKNDLDIFLDTFQHEDTFFTLLLVFALVLYVSILLIGTHFYYYPVRATGEVAVLYICWLIRYKLQGSIGHA